MTWQRARPDAVLSFWIGAVPSPVSALPMST